MTAEASLAGRVDVAEVGTMGLVGQELRLKAAPLELNRHTITPVEGGGYRITFNGAGPLEPGTGCTDTSPDDGSSRQLTCTGSNVIRTRFRLGDLDDLLVAKKLAIQVTADGGGGNDQLEGGSRADSLSGGEIGDSLEGNGGRDRLFGGAGADLLHGNGGNDTARGGIGSDSITGGPGDDLVVGGPGNDSLDGSAGEDKIRAGDGNDVVVSSMGATLFSTDGGPDDVDCGPGRDRVSADRNDRVKNCETVHRDR